MKYKLLVAFLIAFNFHSFCQPKSDASLKELLLKNNDSILQMVLSHPEIYRFQIIYTQINRDKNNKPSFKNYYLNVDPQLYFNPASTVKMPVIFLALEKLNRINKSGVNKFTSLLIDSSYSGQSTAYKDSTSQTGLPSIAQYIRKAFLISDNDAYNRLYQFVGQRTINRELQKKGYRDVRITRQFKGGLSFSEHAHTNGMRFVDKNGKEIYRQPSAYNTDPFDFSHIIKLGKGHLDDKDSLINSPMDFTKVNNISLEDLQQIEQSVLFPESVPAYKRFDLKPTDYEFLYQYMSQFPSETNYPKYNTEKFYDSYAKFFFRGEKMPAHLRVFNKVGWAYGFLTDISYVADFKNKVEYMLSCTVYVNSDGILNDNTYDYKTIGYPFLLEVGKAVYQYELSRNRKYKPDLSRFSIHYEKRDPKDTRPVITEVIN